MSYADHAALVIHSVIAVLKKESRAVRIETGIESVHQLRVASRRLHNALGVFKTIFPKKDRRRWEQKTRGLIKTLSPARDLDVQILYFQNYQRTLKDAALRRAAQNYSQSLKKARLRIQPKILKAIAQIEQQNFWNEIEQSVGKRPADSAFNAVMARQKVLKRLDKVLSFARFVPHAHKTRELHRLRIAAKHLRYTLESFAPLYGKKLDGLIRDILKLHDLLGDLHDYHVWLEQARVSSEDLSPAIRHLQDGYLRAHRNFLKAWNVCQDKNLWGKLRKFPF